MYINFDYAAKKGIQPNDILCLQIIKQMKREQNLDETLALVLTDEFLEKYTQEGYIEEIKGKKGDSDLSKLRLTKKGNKVLEDIYTPNVNEDDIKVAEWLKNIYLKDQKEVGNFKRTKQLIAEFRVHSGIEKNCLAFLCQSFIESETEWQYTQRLEYLFWKKEHMYNTKFDIHQSRLFQFYQKNKDMFDRKFAELE